MVFPLLADIGSHLTVVKLVIMLLLQSTMGVFGDGQRGYYKLLYFRCGAVGGQRGYYGVVAQPFLCPTPINSLWK